MPLFAFLALLPACGEGGSVIVEDTGAAVSALGTEDYAQAYAVALCDAIVRCRGEDGLGGSL